MPVLRDARDRFLTCGREKLFEKSGVSLEGVGHEVLSHVRKGQRLEHGTDETLTPGLRCLPFTANVKESLWFPGHACHTSKARATTDATPCPRT